jgi:hypothetical protein
MDYSNMPSSTKAHIVQKLAYLQNKENHLRQQQIQYQMLTKKIHENSTIRRDVLDCQELQDVLERMEKLEKVQEGLQTQQWQMIIEFGRELQEFLNELQNQDHNSIPGAVAFPATTVHSDWSLDIPRDRDEPVLSPLSQPLSLANCETTRLTHDEEHSPSRLLIAEPIASAESTQLPSSDQPDASCNCRDHVLSHTSRL